MVHEVSMRRFPVLILYSLANAANAMTWITFSPIAHETGAYYGVSLSLVNLLSVVFLAFYLPFTIVSMAVFGRTSLRFGLILGAFLTAVGGWIRYGSTSSSPPSYGLVLFGQCLQAAAQPFFTNLPAKIAARWFPTKERAAATVVGAMFNPIGIAIGTLIPSAFVSPGTIVGFDQLLLCEAIVTTVIFVLILALFTDRPEHPPSSSQQLLGQHETEIKEEFSISKLGAEVRSCFHSWDFNVLLFTFGVGLGLFNSITTLIEQLTSPFGATSDDASLFGGLMIGLGLVGAGLAGVFLDRTHAYKTVLRTGYSGGFVIVIVLVCVISTGSIDGMSALFALLGFIVLPMLPATLDAGAEATFPVSEDVSSGLLMSAGQLTGIVFIYVLQDLTPAPSSGVPTSYVFPSSSIFCIVVYAFPAFSILLYRGTFLRLHADGKPVSSTVGQE